MAKNKDVKRGIVLYLDGKAVEANAQNIQKEMRKVKKEIDGCKIGSDEYVAATKKYRELRSILNEHKKNLGLITEETDKAKRAGEEYARNVTQMLGLNSKFGSSLSSLASGGNVFQNLTAGASAFTRTLLGIMSNPAFLAIAGISGAITAFKFWYDYNKGVAEATRLTREFLGVQGDDLIAIRSEIQSIADAYGKDYKSVLQAVDGLTSQYGITAAEALQTVKDGFIAGADANGSFLQQLGQYSAAFNDIGINAQELTALISQTRSGLFSEEGMAAIQMAGKRIREMGKDVQESLQMLDLNPEEITKGLREGSISTFDVIRKISERMRELGPQSQEVGEVLKDVFGRQGAAAGYQLVASFADVSTSIDECKQQTGEYGEAMEDYVDAQTELNATTAALFDVTQRGFDKMVLSLKTITTKWLTSMLKGLIDICNWFINIYNNSTLLRGSLALVQRTFGGLWDVVALFGSNAIAVFKTIGQVLGGLIDSLANLMDFDFEGAKDALLGMFNNIGDTWRQQMKSNRQAFADNYAEDIAAIQQVINGKIKPITIPVKVEGADGKNSKVDTPTGGNGGNGSGDGGSSGGTGGGGSGDGGSGGGSTTTTKKDTLAERIKKETALINEAVLKQQNIIKKQYATGLIDRQKYNQDMQDLEILRIQKILQIAGLEPEKVAELQNRLTDFAIKAREELEGIDFKPINESSADEFARMNEELDKKMNEQIAIVKQNLRLGNITREEYMKQLNDIDQQHFKESIQLWQDYNEKLAAKAQEGVFELTESQKKALQTFQDTLAPIMQDIGSSVGDGIAKAIRGEKGALKEALKETLKTVVDAIRKMMTAMVVKRTVENVGALGYWGLAKAAGEIALINIAGAALNGLIDGFASGGYTGKGGAYETAGVVHRGEFVANRFAVQNPAVKSVLDVIDQAQKTGNVANLTHEDLASVARSSATSNAENSSNDALSASMVAVLKDCTSMLAAVKKRFDEPIVAETYVTGKGGSEEAARLFDRMNRNANRK